MKLLDIAHYEDYGHEWYFQLLSHYPKFALVDSVIRWDDYGDDKIIPDISLTISTRQLFGLFIRYKRFQFDFDLMTSLPRNLERYRRYQ